MSVNALVNTRCPEPICVLTRLPGHFPVAPLAARLRYSRGTADTTAIWTVIDAAADATVVGFCDDALSMTVMARTTCDLIGVRQEAYRASPLRPIMVRPLETVTRWVEHR